METNLYEVVVTNEFNENITVEKVHATSADEAEDKVMEEYSIYCYSANVRLIG